MRSNSQSSVASASFTAFGIVHLHPDAGRRYSFGPAPAGHGFQLGDVRQTTTRALPAPSSTRPRKESEHGAPGLCGAPGRSWKAALWRLRRVDPRAGAAVGGHAGPVQLQIRTTAFQGESVSVTDLLANLRTGSATLDGLTAQKRGLRPAAVQQRAAQTGGRLGRNLLSSKEHRLAPN